MSYLEQKVSVFRNYRDNVPKQCKLIDFLISDKYKKEVQAIRENTNKEIRNDLKSRLPAITPSGIFKGRRSANNLERHTGLIQIDIDGHDNPQLNMAHAKSVLMKTDIIAFCAYSVSGKGLFGLVPIKNPQQHLEHFLSLEKQFKNELNIVIDRSCKDVTRLRGYSYDADYYINENPAIYERIYVKPKQRTVTVKTPVETIDNFAKALTIIENNCLDITGSNEQWFSILCSIANEYGEAGRQCAHIVSQYSTLYDYDRCDKDYDRAIKSGYSYSIGTFYHFLKQHIVN